MRTRWGKTSFCLWVTALVAALSASPVHAVNDLLLVIDPASQTAMPGDTVTVRLDVAALSQAINGMQALLRYDPTQLTLIDIVPTDLGLAPPNAGWVEVFRADIAGDVTYAVTINGGQIAINHTIAVLTFQVIAEGSTNVSFRPDVAPFTTKVSLASNNATVFPNRFDSGTISLSCDDGLFCNGAETFDGFVCQPGANPCDDVVGCTDDSCIEATDTCVNTVNDFNCDDGLFCNGAEFCDAVLDCRPGADPCDDVVGCTDDSCIELTDTCVNTVNDFNCDDGLFCNGAEFCDAVLDCQAGSDPCNDVVGCTDDSCIELTDTCVNTANDLNCADDAVFCNGTEFCDVLADCSSTGNPCLPTQFCNDTTDFCDQCVGDLDCDDGVPCTDDVCVAGACTVVLNDANCDDGLFCNGSETCDAVLNCQAGLDPCDDGVACTDDSCDDLADTCSNVANDANCDDTLFCNGSETCDAVLDCQPGLDPCDDGVPCTDDTCDDLLDQCSNLTNDANCDDALFCNGSETCDAVLDCQPGVSPCDDLVLCTDDVCDELVDACANLVNDLNCDDGLFCNGGETCDAVLDCQPGLDPCEDNIPCTVDTCDDLLDVCSNAPDDLVCDDAVFCNGTETCDALLGCQAGVDPCAPLICDEVGLRCLAPLQISSLEVYYPGRFADAADTSKQLLAVGSIATAANVTNYWRGVTGIRVSFDQTVVFQTTPAAAFSFEWTTGSGTTFSAVAGAATNIAVTAVDLPGGTVVSIVLADDFVRRRWLKVTLDAAQVTTNGVALDGELAGSPIALPSGDGNPGGNAVFALGNVSGDANGDLRTLLADIGLIRGAVNPFLAVPITDALDVDKDGKILLSDVGRARLDVNPFFRLPLIAP